MRLRRTAIGLFALLTLVSIVACGGGGLSATATPGPDTLPTLPPAESDDFNVGRPQNRAGIGDVDRAFSRYEATRSDLIALYQEQPWYKDGLTRDEALFVERGLTFVASYSGPRRADIREQTIRQKLYRYERVPVGSGEIELLLIFEPGQDGDREMSVLARVIPVLEQLVGVPYPEKVMTVVNGNFEINDFNDGQFIRIAECCAQTPFILAHELSHAYWSMASSWFNEGMADIYATMALAQLNKEAPAGWRPVATDLDSYYRSRKSLVDSGRFPNITLPRRLASDGLYEVADVFLLDIRKQLGDDEFRATARDIYLASDYGRYILRDKRIEDQVLKRAKGDAKPQIMSMFNRLVWGDDGERYQQLQELEGS